MISQEQKRKDFRTLFELWYNNPKVEKQVLSEVLGVSFPTVNVRIEEAHNKGYITGPQIRKMSYKNFIEYVTVADVYDSIEAYERFEEDERIIYQAIFDGFCNIRIVSEEKITIDGALVSGPCTDRYMSYPPKYPWGTSMQKQKKMIEEFNPDEYTPKNYIENHWDKTAEWTEKDETLFRIFKYKIRQPFSPIMRKYHIQRSIIIDWLEKVPEYCKYYTAYFPETIAAYEPILYMFDTDYEDFVIDLFSQLPTSIYYYKVSNKLFIHTRLDTGLMKSKSSVKNVGKTLPYLKIIRDLKRKEIVKGESHAEQCCYWRREVD